MRCTSDHLKKPASFVPYFRLICIGEIVIARKPLYTETLVFRLKDVLLVGQINNTHRVINPPGALFLNGSQVWDGRKRIEMVVHYLHT